MTARRLASSLPLRSASLALLFGLAVHRSQAQPPPGGGGGGAASCISSLGQVSSSSCSTTTGSCSTSAPGTTTYAAWVGSWSDGVFTGTLTANGCPHDARAFQQSNVAIPWLTTTSSVGGGASATCCATSFPVSGYTSPPKAADVIGNVGFAMHGESVYGPFDAGFASTTRNLCVTTSSRTV